MIPDESRIEERFKESLDAWVEDGWPTGSFLRAVLENDLKGAIKRGDQHALDNLPHIVAYVYWSCPAECQGSPERVAEWRGLSPDDKRAWQDLQARRQKAREEKAQP